MFGVTTSVDYKLQIIGIEVRQSRKSVCGGGGMEGATLHAWFPIANGEKKNNFSYDFRDIFGVYIEYCRVQ